jgi:hypothetical protein
MNTCKECLSDYPESETVWRFSGYICEWCLEDLQKLEDDPRSINDIVREIAESEAN